LPIELVTPERIAQLVAFLQKLGLDPAAPGGPGATASGLAPIDEALSHSSLRETRNHERLEFLGDAVLRLAATDYLRREQAQLRVGEQSALRSQMVSDEWLANLGQECGLADVLRMGPMASRDQAGRATVLAECTEALLGGLYLAWGGALGGLEPVVCWLSPFWRRTAEAVLADPHRNNWKSALQEWSQHHGYGLPHYECVEKSLAHGDPMRFYCRVQISATRTKWCIFGVGWGRSRRVAEQQAARQALAETNRFEAIALISERNG
jgi:ribonuclease-3